jgi:hypothetical protein
MLNLSGVRDCFEAVVLNSRMVLRNMILAWGDKLTAIEVKMMFDFEWNFWFLKMKLIKE